MGNIELKRYKCGLIKHVGNSISVTNKLLASIEPQLIPYRKKDKWGFCTPDKKIVIDCVYDNVESFSKGIARVEENGKVFFINKEGNIVVDFEKDI
jgi:hypothetical protein